MKVFNFFGKRKKSSVEPVKEAKAAENPRASEANVPKKKTDECFVDKYGEYHHVAFSDGN